ncbi:hypothetical protein D3C72_1398830 [compost metagenome]
MEAGVDVDDFARGRAAQVRAQPQGGAGDAFHRGLFLDQRELRRLGVQAAPARDPGQAKGAHRARRDGVDADVLRTQVARDVAGRGFQGGLGHAHGVVVGDDPLGPEVGQGDHRAAVGHQFRRALGHVDEAEGRDVHGQQEAVAGGVVDEGALQLVLVGEGHRVDDEVDRAELFFQLFEGLVHRGVVGDVGLDQQLGADAFGQGTHAALKAFAEVGEGQLGALGGQLRGDAPGDGTGVRDPHDQALLALHQVAGGHIPAFARRHGFVSVSRT